MSALILSTAFAANGESPVFRLKSASLAVHSVLTGTGAVGATVSVYVTNFPNDADSWVNLTSAAKNVSGTTKAFASAELTTAFAYGKIVVTGLTGTGAKLTVAVADADGSSGGVADVRITNADGVTFQVNEADLANIGTEADAAASTDTGSFSIIAFIKRGMQNWTTLLTRIPALGGTDSAHSVPVVLSSDGPFASNFGAKADAAATTDTGSFSLIALAKRALQNWTTLLAAVSTGGVSVKSGPGTTVQATIANGGSLSGIIDFGAARLGRIGCPSNVDGNTKLSFQTSHDGVTFRNLFDAFGSEYTVAISTDRSVVPDLTMFAAARYIKIRFGTSTVAGTNATADRTFDLSTLA